MNCFNCGKHTNNPKFCGRSCSASYTNKTHPKRSPITRYCLYCNKKCHSNNSKYCSRKCSQIKNRQIKDKSIVKNGFGNGHYHNNTIRNYLIRHYGNKCMICNLDANNWKGKPITLVVDHIDGKSNNNILENLRIVCPNCDSQLPTYKAKNKGNSTRSYFIVQK